MKNNLMSVISKGFTLAVLSLSLSAGAMAETKLEEVANSRLDQVTQDLMDKMNLDLDTRVKAKLGHSPELYETEGASAVTADKPSMMSAATKTKYSS